MTTLSVLLPVYNAAPYLTETLNSLLGQTRPADQIVIINDGSTDQSMELLEKFRSLNSRIQLIDQKNQGVSAARNRGLAVCEGDFIALMDADDICHPHRFAVQLEAMHKQRLDLCGSWIRMFGRKSREVRYPCTDTELKWNFLFLGRTLPNPTVMLRRQAIGTTLYREGTHYAEDFGFFLDLLLRNPGIRLANLPQVLLNYRKHETQASQNLKNLNQLNIVTLLQDLLPKANIEATASQTDQHYLLWDQGTPLSIPQLQEYLPLMADISGWLLYHTGDRRQAASHWSSLAKTHRGLGREAYDLILRAAGNNWPLAWRMAERMLSFAH
jgi:hypothetical protein